jgi:hypothetical protein
MNGTDQSGFRALVQLAAITLLGLVAAPALLGASASPLASLVSGLLTPDGAWLAVGLLLVVWLIAVGPALARALADALIRRLPTQPSRSRETALRLDASGFARWSIVAICFLVAQAILRRPLASLLDTQLAVPSSDSIVSACTLGLVLVVVWRLYGAARPLIEASARGLLDTLLSAEVSPSRTDSVRPTSVVPVSEPPSHHEGPPGTSHRTPIPEPVPVSPTGEPTRGEPPPTDRTVVSSPTSETTRFDVTSVPSPTPCLQSARDETLATSTATVTPAPTASSSDTGLDTLDPAEDTESTVPGDSTLPGDSAIGHDENATRMAG